MGYMGYILDVAWPIVQERFKYIVDVPSLLPGPGDTFVCRSPFGTEPFNWCVDHFGTHLTAERLNVKNIFKDTFPLNEDSIWDVSGGTFYFQNERDAAIFKIWFG